MRSDAAGSRKPPRLAPSEIRRYSRQAILPDVGLGGQLKLKRASVLLIGAGGLGSPAAIYLAAAGVGRIGLVDDDIVDLSNLHRQVLYGTRDVGRKKVRAAAERLESLNPRVSVELHDTRLTSGNAIELVAGYDIVLDGTDNFPARYLINDACVLSKKPMVYGGVYHFGGQAAVFDSTRGPCYRCVLPEPPALDSVPGCAQAGVLGVLPGIIGAIQAAEAIKLILGLGSPLVDRMIFYDAQGAVFDEMPMAKDPDCPICGVAPTITSLIDYERPCDAVKPAPPAKPGGRPSFREIGVPEFERMRRADKKLLILDIREPEETTGRPIPYALCIPRSQVTARLNEIPGGKDIVVVCRIGVYSLEVIRILLDKGYRRLFNLEGGYTAWAYRIGLDD